MNIPALLAKINALFSDQPAGSVVRQCAAPVLKTGLGGDVDSLAAKSPTLAGNLKKLKEDRWTIEYGEPGKGSFCNKDEKKIVIDPNSKGDPKQVVQTLAHESGHALYQQDPYVPPAGKTREEYVAANVNSNLKDEGEATLTNCQVRKEILDNGGGDIGIAGKQGDKYQKIHEQYPDAKDRDKARQEIGTLFADGEHASTRKEPTPYRQYYGKTYADFYDKQAGGSK